MEGVAAAVEQLRVEEEKAVPLERLPGISRRNVYALLRNITLLYPIYKAHRNIPRLELADIIQLAAIAAGLDPYGEDADHIPHSRSDEIMIGIRCHFKLKNGEYCSKIATAGLMCNTHEGKELQLEHSDLPARIAANRAHPAFARFVREPPSRGFREERRRTAAETLEKAIQMFSYIQNEWERREVAENDTLTRVGEVLREAEALSFDNAPRRITPP